MDFAWSPEQQQMRDAIARVCAPFDADYWLRKDRDGGFPEEFHRALAASGWLGIAMPEAYGGAGQGIGEAALMMHTIAASGAGMSGASAVHMNIFGLHPVVVFGSDAQKRRWLPPVVSGDAVAAFAISEAEAGSDVGAMTTTARRDGGGYVIDGRKTWISNAGIADRYVVFARFPEAGERGFGAFVVDADNPGLRVTERIDVTAPHPLGTVELEAAASPRTR